MRPAQLAAGLVLFAAAAAAQSAGPLADTTDAAIASLETGVVCNPLVTEVIAAPGTVSGTVNVLEDLAGFTLDSRRVPAVIGLSFGALAMAKGRDIPLVEMTITHPPMGPTGATSQTYVTWIAADRPVPILYSLEYEDELVIGTWTFEASAEGRVLYHRSFDLVPPQDMPELATMCGYENLLS